MSKQQIRPKAARQALARRQVNRVVGTLNMERTRAYLERILFPGAHGQRRRHMRFFVLAVVLGILLCLGIGITLYALNMQGRM
jgi:hypothetical protein